MQAVILSVGDELISGATIDTNSAYLSMQLGERGIPVLRHVTVGDQVPALTRAITEAADDAELVIITGGLGPTVDDITRDALAAAMGGVELREDVHSMARIEGFFKLRNRPLRPSNRVQAMMPAGACALDNDCGTAPGIAARVGRAQLYCLPGPPFEMKDMFAKRVAPALPEPGRIVRRILHTFGAGESEVGERIADLMARGRNPAVGTTVSGGVVSIRVLAQAQQDGAAEKLADADAAEIRRRLGELVFGQGEQSLAEVVGGMLAGRGQTLATAESCTGGMVGQMITDISGASRYYLGGVVAYANQAKADLLGVEADLIKRVGAVSEEVAGAMAEGARRRFGSDWAISITGIAGPTGGSPEKPVGLVYIGLAGPAGTRVHGSVFPGMRQLIRLRSALAALNHLRLALK